jgi:hypothetical protein
MFYCQRCDNYIDSDYSPHYEDPDNLLELICKDCYDKLTEEED